MSKQEFEAVIEQNPKFPGSAYVTIPFDVEQVYGTKGQIKVKATFDGHPYRGSIANMGTGGHILGVSKAIRTAIGKTHGDSVKVVLEKDTEPRTVVVPEDLKQTFKKQPKAEEFFESLSFTNRKEYVRWIEGARKQATRSSRLQKSIRMLLDGVKHP